MIEGKKNKNLSKNKNKIVKLQKGTRQDYYGIIVQQIK